MPFVLLKPRSVTMSEITAADPATLIDELGRQFEVARAALTAVGSIARQLQRATAEAAAVSGPPRLVRMRAKALVHPVTGEQLKRPRGWPRGSRNCMMLLMHPTDIELLRTRLS